MYTEYTIKLTMLQIKKFTLIWKILTDIKINEFNMKISDLVWIEVINETYSIKKQNWI